MSNTIKLNINQIDFDSVNKSISNLSDLKPFENLKKVINTHDFAAFFSSDEIPNLFHHHHHLKFQSDKEKEDEDNNSIGGSIKTSGPEQVGDKYLNQPLDTVFSELVLNHKNEIKGELKLSSPLSLSSNTTPNTSNIEIKSINSNIQNLYIYFLSELLIGQPLQTIRKTMSFLKNSFKLSKDEYSSIERKAYQLTKYYIYELELRKEEIEKDIVNNQNDFKDKITFEAWKKMKLQLINEQIEKSEKLPGFLETIIFQVKKAKDLPIKDLETKSSDPYVTLSFTNSTNEKPYKSKPLFKSTTMRKSLDPEWNECFVMSSDKMADNIIVLSVMDEDLVTKNDFMGYTLIHLDDHKQTLPFEDIVQTHKILFKEKKKSIISNILHHDSLSPKNSKNNLNSEIQFQFYPIIREVLKSSSQNKCNDETINNIIQSNPYENIKSLLDSLLVENTIQIPKEILELIELYEIRVGLTPIFRLTYHLEILTSKFIINSSEWFNEIKQLLIQINKLLLKPNSNQHLNHFFKIRENISNICEQLLMKYPLSFPVLLDDGGKVKGISEFNRFVLKTCIEILFLTCPPGEEKSNLIKTLEKPVNKVFSFFFDMVKEKSEVSINASKQFDNLVGLLSIYDSIKLQLSSDIDIYSTLFPSDIDLSTKSVVNYYNLLKENTLNQLSKETEVCMETFALLKKIQDLHSNTLQDYIDSELKDNLMNCDQIFSRFISMWIDESKNQFLTWTQRSLSNEEWKPLYPEHKVLHSTSVHDLFSIFEIGKNHLFSLNLDSVTNHLNDFINIINYVYMEYIDNLMTSIVSDLQKLELEEQNDKSFNVNYFNNFIKALKDKEVVEEEETKLAEKTLKKTITNNNIINLICIKLNNLEYSRNLLDEFANDVELKSKSYKNFDFSKVSESFETSFSNSKSKYEYLIELIIGKFSKWIKICLNTTIFSKDFFSKEGKSINKDNYLAPIQLGEDKIQSLVDPLFTFLNNELSTLSNSLYSNTFSKFIKGMWLSIWKEIERILFPDSMKKELDLVETNFKSSLVLAVYEQLESFFFADGKGVSLEQLRDSSQYVFYKIYLYFTPTENLISIYNNMSNENISKNLFKPNDTLYLPSKFAKSPQFSNYFKGFYILVTLNMRIKYHSDPVAKEMVSKLKGNYKVSYIEDKFHLDIKPDQELLDRFKCKTSFGIPTQVYILKYNICWSSYTSYNENNTKVNYCDISSISKESFNSLNSIHLITNQNKIFDFWAFKPLQREKEFKLISNQAHIFNEKIKLIENNNVNKNESPNPTTNQEAVKNNFNLFETDKIISTFSVLKHGIVGKLIVSENYLCYHNQITSSNQKYSWVDIIKIEKETSLFITLGIKISFRSGKEKLYTGFFDKDQLFKDLTNTKKIYQEKLNKNK